MHSDSFQKAYDRLNPSQKQAVDAIEGPVMVIAGAGTGKTQVLTVRIAQILKKTDIHARNILALTFTESAVLTMRERLASLIGTTAYDVCITTFHSFCNDLIMRYAEIFPMHIASRSITEIEQIEILEQILTAGKFNILTPIGNPLYYTRKLLKIINDMKQEAITPDILTHALDEEETFLLNEPDQYHTKGAHKGKRKSEYIQAEENLKKNREMCTVFSAYQTHLHNSKLYDFSDMLLTVIDAMKRHQSFLQDLQETYQYILVDEHQDTSRAQQEILSLLCSFDNHPNLFVVGDDKQAIFRFQGATVENFLSFREKYPSTVIVTLTENYRSSQTLLDASHAMIQRNPIREDLAALTHRLNAARSDTAHTLIRIAETPTQHDEFLFVASDIEKRHQEGLAYGDIAILARENASIRSCAHILDALSIPHVLLTEQDLLKEPYIADFCTLLRACVDPSNDALLIRALHLPVFELSFLALYDSIQRAKEKKIPLWKYLREEPSGDIKIRETLEKIESFASSCVVRDAVDVFIDIFRSSGMLNLIIVNPHQDSILAGFHRLYEELQDYCRRNNTDSLEAFLSYLNTLQAHNLVLPNPPSSPNGNQVLLMTVHKAKGAEFPHVYVIDVTDKTWGKSKNNSHGFHLPARLYTSLNTTDWQPIHDERRLFYVALTRARETVTLSYSIADEKGKSALPSPFIAELPDNLREQVDTSTPGISLPTRFPQFTISHHSSISRETYRTYLSSLVMQKGISPTGYNHFLVCPWRYVFEDVIGIPSHTTDAQVFGIAIHQAVHRLLGEKKQSATLLTSLFSALIKQSHVSPSMKEKMLKDGNEMLPDFYRDVISRWNQPLNSELFIQLKLGSTLLRGKIDVLEHTIDGYHVHDIKTGRVKTKGTLLKQDEDGDARRQLLFYCLMLSTYDNGRFATNLASLQYVKAESPRTRSVSFVFEKEEIEGLQREIYRMFDAVMQLSFWDDTCETERCEYCVLRSQLG